MSAPEIKIINVHCNDDLQLTGLLCLGFKLIQAIPYISPWTDFRTVYSTDGRSHQEEVIKNNHMIKYILERDNITKLLHG